jgi:hypothetical protein
LNIDRDRSIYAGWESEIGAFTAMERRRLCYHNSVGEIEESRGRNRDSLPPVSVEQYVFFR